MNHNEKDIRLLLEEIFPSKEMTSYLARCPFGDDIDCQRNGVYDDAPPETLPLSRYQMAVAVAGAPVSLEQKRELFRLLAEGEEDGFFSAWSDVFSQAVQEMQPKPGDFFYLTACSHSNYIFHNEEDRIGAFLSWRHIFEAIREYCGDDAQDEESLIWFDVEKWTLEGNGRLNNTYSYEVIGDKVCFCRRKDPFDPERPDPEVLADLNLPVPFHAGDIVTIDCRPFVPLSRAVILEIGDNSDCCCLQALYYAGDGIWNAGAVKHGHIFPNHIFSKLSPLYRLASFHGKLPDEEGLLAKVSRYIDGKECRGAALWKYLYSINGRREKDGVAEELILSYLEATVQPDRSSGGKADGTIH